MRITELKNLMTTTRFVSSMFVSKYFIPDYNTFFDPRCVDQNWLEVSLGERSGLVPASYLETEEEIR